MSVGYTSKVERIRRPDGTRVPVPGGSPVTGLGAVAAATTSPITGAASAAVRSREVTPHVAAVAVFESTAQMPDGGGPDAVEVVPQGVAPFPFLPRPGSTQQLGAGRRRNSEWRPFDLDTDAVLDGGYQLGPDVGDTGVAASAFTGAVPLERAVANAAATTAGAAWTTTGGTYSRPSSPTLPSLGLEGDQAHRVTSDPLALASLVSPWGPVRYRITPGRVFTAAAWVTSNVPVNTYRYRLELRELGGARTVTLYSTPAVVTGPMRFVGTFTVPAGPLPGFPAGVTGGVRFVAARLTVERVAAVLAPSRPSTVTFDVRGAHFYAGGDRGDDAGLRVVPVVGAADENEFGLTVRVPASRRFTFTRVDIHGSDTYGHVTSATLYRPGVPYAHAESAGRLTARLAQPVEAGAPPTPGAPDVRVYVEEVNGGPGSDVYVQAVELMHEQDLTGRVVSATVDRSTDADPADSTVPIGNYAASTCRLALDNTDRALSPFRADYIDLRHRLEVAAGVVYTNRHDDPHGDGLTTPNAPQPWTGPRVPVVADHFGVTPPAASTMLTPDGLGAVQAPGGGGWRVRVGVWALGGPGPGEVRVGYRSPTGAAVTLYAGHVPAREAWRRHDVVVDLPDTATMTVIGRSPGIALAEPSVERIEPATGDVIEVVETTPLGVFVTTDWPTATDEDTVTVNAVDLLGDRAGQDYTGGVTVGQTIEDTLRDVFRAYLDLGDDEVVVDGSTPLLPYALPAVTVGEMVADLAKAGALTAHTDGAGRAVAVSRQNATDDAVQVEYRADNALVSGRIPFAPGMVRNDVTAVGYLPSLTPPGTTVATVGNDTPTPLPYTPDEDGRVEVWELTGQEVHLAPGESVSLTVEYEAVAAVLSAEVVAVRAYDVSELGRSAPTNLAASSPVPPPLYDPTWTSTEPVVTATLDVGATSSVLTLTARTLVAPSGRLPAVYAPAVVVDHVRIAGVGIVTAETTRRFARDASVAAYGRHPATVPVRLAASPGQLAVVAEDVLDNYALRGSDGTRVLPDVEAETLGDPWRELGDRVLVVEPRAGIGGEYRVASHVLDVGTELRSSFYLRRAADVVSWVTLDVSELDGEDVLTY